MSIKFIIVVTSEEELRRSGIGEQHMNRLVTAFSGRLLGIIKNK